MESLNPVRGGHRGLKKKRTEHIIHLANGALSLGVLLGSIWAGHAYGDTVKEEELTSGGIIKFTIVVTLDALDGGTKLCADIAKEISESRECFRLEAKRDSPKKMRAIIQNDEVVFVIGEASDR